MKRINCVPLTRRENDRRVFVQTRERRGFAPDPTRGMIPLDPQLRKGQRGDNELRAAEALGRCKARSRVKKNKGRPKK